MIITSDDKAADMMRALRNQGRAPGDTWLQHTYLGYNYRLDEMSAALGTVQMTRLDELLKKRDRVANWYTERLSEIPGVEPPVIEPFTTRMSWFVYVVRFDKRSTATNSPNDWKDAAFMSGRISFRSICNRIWPTASGIVKAIFQSRKIWAGAGWPCPSPV